MAKLKPLNGHDPEINAAVIVHSRTDESPVAAHFTSKGHTEADSSVMIIDRCLKDDAILRKIRESRWIRSLKTS